MIIDYSKRSKATKTGEPINAQNRPDIKWGGLEETRWLFQPRSTKYMFGFQTLAIRPAEYVPCCSAEKLAAAITLPSARWTLTFHHLIIQNWVGTLKNFYLFAMFSNKNSEHISFSIRFSPELKRKVRKKDLAC